MAQATWIPRRSRQLRDFRSSMSPMNMMTLARTSMRPSEPERDITPSEYTASASGKPACPVPHDVERDSEDDDRCEPDRHAAAQGGRRVMALVSAGTVEKAQSGGEVSHQQTEDCAR